MRELFNLLYALSLSARAWRHYRESPDFSLAAGLKIVLFIVVCLAALIAVAIGVASVQWRDSNVGMAVTFAVIGAGGAALILGLLRLTNGPPPSAPAMTAADWPRRSHLTPALGAAVVALAITVPLSLSLQGTGAVVAGGVAIADGLTIISVLLPLAFVAGRADLGAAAVAASPWARWRFDAARWRAWADARRALDDDAVRRGALAARTWTWITIVVGAIIFVAALSQGGGIGFSVATAVVMTAVTMGVIGAFNGYAARGPERRWREHLAAEPEVVFGAEGVLVGANYRPWRNSGAYLVSAATHTGAAGREIVLAFTTYDGGAYRIVEVRAPIPQGAEADLARLRTELTTRLPKARVAL